MEHVGPGDADGTSLAWYRGEFPKPLLVRMSIEVFRVGGVPRRHLPVLGRHAPCHFRPSDLDDTPKTFNQQRGVLLVLVI